MSERPFAAAALLAALALAGCKTVPVKHGDPVRGEAVVSQWCTQCHTARGTEHRTGLAPTFEEVAQRPGRTEDRIRRFLDEDHFPMSTYRLLEPEKDDVAAFIASLKR